MPPIRPELLDELLKDYQKPEDLLGDNGLLRQLTKALVERALDGELTSSVAKNISERDKAVSSFALRGDPEQALDKSRLPYHVSTV